MLQSHGWYFSPCFDLKYSRHWFPSETRCKSPPDEGWWYQTHQYQWSSQRQWQQMSYLFCLRINTRHVTRENNLPFVNSPETTLSCELKERILRGVFPSLLTQFQYRGLHLTSIFNSLSLYGAELSGSDLKLGHRRSLNALTKWQRQPKKGYVGVWTWWFWSRRWTGTGGGGGGLGGGWDDPYISRDPLSGITTRLISQTTNLISHTRNISTYKSWVWAWLRSLFVLLAYMSLFARNFYSRRFWLGTQTRRLGGACYNDQLSS